MAKIRQLLSLLLCACMLLGASAFAEDAAAATETLIPSEAVLVTLNGEDIVWGDVENLYNNLVSQYGNYYDLSQQSSVELFRAVAMENRITEVLLMQKAKELGLSELTDEEAAQAIANAESDWASAIENYISYFHSELTDESSEEDKAAANAEAENYYHEAGYTLEGMREEYQRYAVMDKVQAMMVQDAVVTDDEVEAAYQALVAADKALYENDIAAYVEYNSYVDQMAMYAALYGSGNDMDHAWYKPAGFRAVKHILLPVDEALMAAYTDLQARYEEQQEAAAAAEMDEAEAADAETAEPTVETDETAEPEPTAEPVTEQQVNEAKAAILASLADKIEEINQKVSEGVDFDELIAAYAVNADGTASDPGMTSEPYKTSGYEVCAASSNYVPEFVEAAMSLNAVGDVSAPYLSSYGVHIVKYIADVPAGPIAMTDAQRQAKHESMLEAKRSELYNTQLEKWLSESTIEYTGVTPSIADIQAAEAAAEPAPEATEEPQG